MAFFPPGRVADDAGSGGVALFQGQAGQAGDDGLHLVVIGRPVGDDGDDGAQGGPGLGQIADPGSAPGRHGL